MGFFNHPKIELVGAAAPRTIRSKIHHTSSVLRTDVYNTLAMGLLESRPCIQKLIIVEAFRYFHSVLSKKQLLLPLSDYTCTES